MDGIRAIACLLVLIGHLNKAIQRLSPGDDLPFSHNGLMGVTIFFVLSGFLLTHGLLTKQKEGSIHLANFYMRRVLRIFPLYFFYLTLAGLAILLVYPAELNIRVLPYYIFLCPNIPWIFSIGLPNLHHYWSLGVEEQFYLLWPVLFLANRKRLLFCTISILFLLFTLRLYLLNLPAGSLKDSFVYAMGYPHILIGCLGAILMHSYPFLMKRYRLAYFLELSCWAFLVMLLSHLISFGNLNADVGAILTLVIIYLQCSENKKLIDLDHPLFRFIGTLSFGIYVYHPLIISSFRRVYDHLGLTLSRIEVIPLFVLGITLVTVSIAFLSYHYLEKPFLKKKQFYPLSPNRKST